MININFNGKFLQVPNTITIKELAIMNGYKTPMMVKVNDKKLQLAQYKEYKLNDGDTVIMKRVLGGG